MIIDQISRELLIPRPAAEALVRKATYSYKTYTIPKRGGGQRTIHHPAKALKSIQRWLVDRFISTWPVHEAARAYRPGVGVLANVRPHRENPYLVRFDLENFFPSFSSADVQNYLATQPPGTTAWDDADIQTFVSLVCRDEQLTIGAPSSPGLSNAICFDLDSKLEALAIAVGVTYTRYADDMFFSGVDKDVLRSLPPEVECILHELPCPMMLQLNAAKTKFSSRASTRRITGIVISPDATLGIGRVQKRIVKAKIHQWGKLTPEERASLAGMLAYIRNVEPGFIDKMVLKYGAKLVNAAVRGV